MLKAQGLSSTIRCPCFSRLSNGSAIKNPTGIGGKALPLRSNVGSEIKWVCGVALLYPQCLGMTRRFHMQMSKPSFVKIACWRAELSFGSVSYIEGLS